MRALTILVVLAAFALPQGAEGPCAAMGGYDEDTTSFWNVDISGGICPVEQTDSSTTHPAAAPWQVR